MGRPRANPDTPATTDRLLEAAEHCFAASGYEATRLEDIARRAGITRPSLLYHFETKERLYGAVVERAFGQLRDALMSVSALDLDFGGVVVALSEAYSDFLRDHPGVASVVLQEFLRPSEAGQNVAEREVVPVTDWVESYLVNASDQDLRPGLPVRQAIVTIAISALVRASIGDLGDKLWGPGDDSASIARYLFLKDG